MDQCLCCGSNAIQEDFLVPSIGLTFLRCKGCGLRFSKDNTWFLNYEKYNYPQGETAELEADGLFARYRRVLEKKRPEWLDRELSVLDIGCGNALFLKHVADSMGGKATCVGVDPALSPQVVSGSGPCELIKGYFSTSLLGDRKFDVVTIFGNLMLHEDPFSTLRDAIAVLRPGGIVLFDVKNADCSIRRVVRRAIRIQPGVVPDGWTRAAFHGMRYQFNKSVLRAFFQAEGVRWEMATFAPRSQFVRSKAMHSKGIRRSMIGLFDFADRLSDQQAWIEAVVEV